LALVSAFATPALAQQFKGSGPRATPMFALASGLAVFETEHRGEGAFLIKLMDAQGNVVSEIAQGTGVFGGSKAVKIPASGNYLMDVVATGEWSIRLRRTDVEIVAADSSTVRGTEAGRTDGAKPGTGGWFARGLVGGLILGPVGTAIAVNKAQNSSLPAAQNAANALPLGEPAYTAAYREAFADRLGTRRQRSALIGGVIGTGVLTVVLLQAFDLVGSAEGDNPNGGGNPALVVPILRWWR
jgi:hypothetical protein